MSSSSARPWTNQNKAYTIRPCQGPGRRDLVQWQEVHSCWLTRCSTAPWVSCRDICSGGTDHEYDNHVRPTCRSGPYPNPQGYPQYQPYPLNLAAPVPQPQVQQSSQQRQTQKGQLKCWSYGSPRLPSGGQLDASGKKVGCFSRLAPMSDCV